MKLFFAYLRQRWKVLLGAVLFYALFAVSFALYGLRWRRSGIRRR